MTQSHSHSHSQSGSERKRDRLRGVTEQPASHGEGRYRAWIGRGKGRQVNLGLYPDRWLAAFAYNAAVEAVRGDLRTKNEIPEKHQPSADQVRRINARVRGRLGLDQPIPHDEVPPSADQLLTLLEITVASFWRGQVATHVADLGRELQVAARRLAESARLLLWSHSSGHPTACEALALLLGRRLDRTFRRADVTREVLDDDGDDELRLARWLVYPDELPGGGGFRETIAHLYLADEAVDSSRSSTIPAWALTLGVVPPFSSERVRFAYRARSKTVHPDAGGDHAEFVRLQAAYEDAQNYCTSRGL
ncbi:J domain-containing protein [Singulisphaera sp. Ch08]|uniref:J domain-containing protein n=1 Tax=Singulisphaera sp. Ch08 TaxID=3120278 RepID=A0AAU7CGS6_9BACT